MIALLLLVTLILAGAVTLFLGLRNAPEGYEDTNGFHLVWQNDAPERENIVCIWAARCEVSAIIQSLQIRSAA